MPPNTHNHMKQYFCDWLKFFVVNYDLLNGHPFTKFRSPEGNYKNGSPNKECYQSSQSKGDKSSPVKK